MGYRCRIDAGRWTSSLPGFRVADKTDFVNQAGQYRRQGYTCRNANMCREQLKWNRKLDQPFESRKMQTDFG